MRNKKLFKLLRLLSKDELSRFGDFVRSPFFNKNQKAVLLWDLLEGYAPLFDNEELKDYQIYKHIYDKPVSIETVFRYTTRLFENFLVQIRHREEHYYKKYLLLDELSRLESWRDFIGQYKAVNGRLKMEKRRGATFHYIKHLIGKAHLDFLINEGAGKEELAIQQQVIIEDLDQFYSVKRIQFAAELVLLKDQDTFEDEALLLLKTMLESKAGHSPIVRLQYHLLCCGLKSNRVNFEAIIDLPNETLQAIPRKVLQLAYRHAAYFCHKKTATDPSFLDLLFILCQKVLNQNFPNQQVENAAYWLDVLIQSGCKLQFFTETKELLGNFKHHLAEKSRDLDFHCHLGYIYYKEQQPTKAIKHFRAARSFKQPIGVLAHSFLLRIAFQRREDDFLYMVKEFVLRTQKSKAIDKVKKGTYIRFARLLEQSYKSNLGLNPSEKEETITACPEEHREWLGEIIK